VINNRIPVSTGQYSTFTYWLSFLSIKGILRFEAKAIEFRETTKIARYIIK
jgi:hypothetical protein